MTSLIPVCQNLWIFGKKLKRRGGGGGGHLPMKNVYCTFPLYWGSIWPWNGAKTSSCPGFGKCPWLFPQVRPPLPFGLSVSFMNNKNVVFLSFPFIAIGYVYWVRRRQRRNILKFLGNCFFCMPERNLSNCHLSSWSKFEKCIKSLPRSLWTSFEPELQNGSAEIQGDNFCGYLQFSTFLPSVLLVAV